VRRKDNTNSSGHERNKSKKRAREKRLEGRKKLGEKDERKEHILEQ